MVSGLAGTGVLPLSDTGSSADAMVARLDPGGEPHPWLGRPAQESVDAVNPVEGLAHRPTSRPAKRPIERHPLPPRSGTGRRVVYDISAQRVWLVRADGDVARPPHPPSLDTR